MSTSTVWVTIVLVALVTLVLKGIGPFVVGARELPAPVVRVVALLGAALLSALVVTSTLVDDGELRLGAKVVGLGVGALLLWRRAHLVLVVVACAGTTALLRQLGLD